MGLEALKTVDASRTRVVYVVDDDEAVRDSLNLLLESYGMNVKGFGSATDFLSSPYDEHRGCLVLDVHMPGMNGLELLDVLKGRRSQLPVILITGRGDTALRERAKQAGAFAVFDKPVDGDALLDAIDTALAS